MVKIFFFIKCSINSAINFCSKSSFSLPARSLMIYEIIGSRILAPYIGTSTYVWTSLIGVILAGLSLGYWLGGKTADRKPDLRFLSGVMFAGASLLCLTILLHAIVLSLISVSNLGLELKSIFAALILFAPASVLLASKFAEFSTETSGAEIFALFKNLYDKPLNSSVPTLTDDLAPVEYYNSRALKTTEK